MVTNYIGICVHICAMELFQLEVNNHWTFSVVVGFGGLFLFTFDREHP